MTFHLSTNRHPDLFKKALGSYSQAQKHLPREFPDLLYNKGSVLSYLQDYRAAQLCFSRAHELDETLNAHAKVEFCTSTLNRIKKDFFDRFFQESEIAQIAKDIQIYHTKRGKMMQRSITKFKNLHRKKPGQFQSKGFGQLAETQNEQSYSIAKVLKAVLKTESGTHMFLVQDHLRHFAIMSVFGGVEGLESTIILKKSIVILIEPNKKTIGTGDSGDRAQVVLLQIFNQDNLIIDNMK